MKLSTIKNRKSLWLALLIVSLWGCNKGPTELSMLPLFSDNMVLQQKKEIPIWGVAPAGTKVSVSFRKQHVEAKSDELGKWVVRLKPEKAGTDETLTIKCKNLKKEFKNVAVGEVWLASGQSNMEVPLVNNWGIVNNDKQEASNANYSDIRLITINRNATFSPVDTISSAGWKPCTPETVKDFSATAYFYGRELYNELNVPIGLIQSAWGGTVAEAWTSAESLELLEDFTDVVHKINGLPKTAEEQMSVFEADDLQMHLEMAKSDQGIAGKDTIFAKRELSDAGWSTMSLPGLWESTELGAFDGSVWFRKHFDVPSEFSGKEMMLNIAPSDDFDEAWVNGKKVGQSGFWGAPRHYKVPAGVVRTVGNVVTVRVSDFQGAGGFNGKPEDFSITCSDWTQNLSGDWLIFPGYNALNIKTQPLKPGEPNNPTALFNGMIAPLVPYAIQGVIWYQGESNTGKAWQYRNLFSALIQDWRAKWGYEFPFYFVQLANHMPRNTKPVDDMWAELREAQSLALKLPNTGMAVAIDIGEADDIHPGNKQDVGKRLALWALNKTYQKDIPFSGPLFKSYETYNGKVIIDFDNTYGGLLTSNGGKVTGFSMAGFDQKFYWANARIDGNSIIVSCDSVPDPHSVRYAWSSNPECNLINSANLPASPFRTDDWELITK